MKNALLSLLIPLALAACAGTTADSADPAAGAGSAPPAATAAATSGVATELPRYHWQLQDANTAGGSRIDALFARADKLLTLDFAEGRVSVANACNRMGGDYRLKGADLVVGRLVSTMMACADPKLMALDGAIGSRLEGTLQASLAEAGGEAPRLRLTTPAGDVLVFAGQATATTRYGNPGETVFLEVAAQRQPCTHPLIPDMQCLQVRELRYDAQGLKQGTPGAFESFYQEIEGYTHEPGIRNVLRVKRFKIANPPADASDRAYVLDTVVESESVDR